MTINNSQSFKYKVAFVGKKKANAKDGKSSVEDTEIVVPLKYLSNFWRSFEMPLINCNVHLELNYIEDYVLSNAGNSKKFEVIDAKLHVPIVDLSTKDSVNLTKQLSEGFKRSVYWNSYQTKLEIVIEKGENIYELLYASFQGVRRLFVFAYVILAGAANDEEIKNYNVLIDGRNFHDQPNNDLIKQYDEVRKVSIGHGDDYTSGSFLDYAYFKDNYRLITVDLSKQML